nr:MAG TPA: hypothetical protein [Caudoviricetes sp.]
MKTKPVKVKTLSSERVYFFFLFSRYLPSL